MSHGWMKTLALAAIGGALTCATAFAAPGLSASHSFGLQTKPPAEKEAAKTEKKSGPFTLDKSEQDLGKMRDTEKRSAEFTLTNAQSKDVHILEVKKTCGCTNAEVSQKALKPGESTVLKVTFDGAHRQGKDRKVVTIVTDAPETPNAEVVITAEVIARIAIEPRAVFLGELARDEKAVDKELKITSRNLDLTIEAPKLTDPRFVFELVSTTKEKSEGDDVKVFTYKTGFKGGSSITDNKCQVMLTTNDKEMGQITIFLLANVVGVMRIIPSHQLQIAEQAPNKAFAKEIQLSHRQSKPWKLLHYRLVDAQPELNLSLEVKPDDPKRPGWTTIVLKGTTPATTPQTGFVIKGSIQLIFDQAEEPDAVIELNGTLRY